MFMNTITKKTLPVFRLATAVIFVLCLAASIALAEETEHSGDSSQEVMIIMPEKLITLHVDVARTPEQWEAGLKGAAPLKEDSGLFYLYPSEQVRSFNTKGVQYETDILLVNKYGRIVGMFEKIKGDRYYPSRVPVVAALQVAGGFCELNGVKAGHFLSAKKLNLTPRTEAGSIRDDREIIERQLKSNMEKYPDDPDVYEALALFYAATGRNQEALELFKNLIEMEVTAPRLNATGVTLVHMAEYEKASQYFRQAIEKDPLFLSAYNNLMRLSQQHGELGDVTAMLEKAVEEHRDFEAGRVALIRMNLAKGDIEKASLLLKDAGDNPDMTRMRGYVELRKGNREKAAEYYLEYITARPYDPHARDLHVFILVHKVAKAQEAKAQEAKAQEAQ